MAYKCMAFILEMLQQSDPFFLIIKKSFNVGVERDVVTSGAQVAMWPMMIVTVTNFSLGSTVEPLNTDTRRYSGTPGDPLRCEPLV